MVRLTDKFAFISGAASRIARSTAIRFAGEGGKVRVADINDDGRGETVRGGATEAAGESGGDVFFAHVDVTDHDSARPGSPPSSPVMAS